MTTLLSSSADNLRCVKELDVLVLDCDYAFDVVTGSHVDPLIRLSNHFIALALQRMTELRSFL